MERCKRDQNYRTIYEKFVRSQKDKFSDIAAEFLEYLTISVQFRPPSIQR